MALGTTATAAGNSGGAHYKFENIELAQFDALMVVIGPPPLNLTVDVQQISGKRHVLVVRTNESNTFTDRSGRIPTVCSIVQLGVEGEVYNITIRFTSRDRLSLLYGALTLYPTSNYPALPYYGYGDAYFVPFSPASNIPAGDVTLSILVSFSKGEPDSDGGFPFLPEISLPPMASTAVFIVVTLIVLYAESFYLLTSYFKGKTSGLTTTNKIIVVASVGAAAVVIYWAFNLLI